jgi:putative sigma-54 modulation protein
MKIDIQFVRMPVSEALEAYTRKKLENLYRKYDWLIQAMVFFKVENDKTDHGKVCEIELSLNGPRIFAAADETHFEMAVKHAISNLEKQLVKRKSILNAH